MKRSVKLPFVSGVWPECPFTKAKRQTKKTKNKNEKKGSAEFFSFKPFHT